MKQELMKFFGWVGSGFAVALSWVTNHSFWWCVLHFCLGWIYVIWNIIVYGWPHLTTR
jgi:MFS-type transporter involved in bile tolerance (Atg22 family)